MVLSFRLIRSLKSKSTKNGQYFFAIWQILLGFSTSFYQNWSSIIKLHTRDFKILSLERGMRRKARKFQMQDFEIWKISPPALPRQKFGPSLFPSLDFKVQMLLLLSKSAFCSKAHNFTIKNSRRNFSNFEKTHLSCKF